MAWGKDGKEREHTTSKSKNSKGQHQTGQARNQADQTRNPNPNTRAGKAIIAAKKKEGRGK
jgi:hypothetical protein